MRRGVGFGVPAVLCGALVLALGLPWWIVMGFMVVFAVVVVSSS
jgi:hypothetical protein